MIATKPEWLCFTRNSLLHSRSKAHRRLRKNTENKVRFNPGQMASVSLMAIIRTGRYAGKAQLGRWGCGVSVVVVVVE